MKSVFLTLLFLVSSLTASATDIKDVDMFGYARAGVGTNTHGGDQECFYNQGAGGYGGVGRNEFRLGNECSNYLEVGLKFNAIKSETKNVYTQFRVANSHNGGDATEATSQSTNFVEAFAEIQGMNDLPYSFWVGKRFYRDQDVHIDDYYYFGSTNGNGAGIGNIDLLNGKLSFAYLREVSDTTSKTNKGVAGITVYDARLKNVPLATGLKQNFWLAFGQAPAGIDRSTNARYVKTNGFILGTLLDYDLHGEGFNHLAVMFGQGLMNRFDLYGDSTVAATANQDDLQRIRVINHTTYNISSKWAFHSSLNYENLSKSGNASEQWYGLGIRPIYRVTPTFHLVTEAGSSVVQNNGKRTLTRLTFAPQLSINENIWGRPVLRAFYTHSFWNTANRAFVAQNAPTYGNSTSGGSYGFQMESFF